MNIFLLAFNHILKYFILTECLITDMPYYMTEKKEGECELEPTTF